MRQISDHSQCRVNNSVRKKETMMVGMYERVNEAWYLRLLEKVRINTAMGETATSRDGAKGM